MLYLEQPGGSKLMDSEVVVVLLKVGGRKSVEKRRNQIKLSPNWQKACPILYKRLLFRATASQKKIDLI